MSTTGQNLANLLEYVGIRSRSYYHSVPEPIRDLFDPLAYYVDFSGRASYAGPYDPSGLPLMRDPTYPRPFPTHLAIYALGHLELYRRSRSEENLNRARICAEWFKANQETDGAWVSTFPRPQFGLKPPFRSAMIQGLAISVLCRMAHALEDRACLDTAVRGLEPFRLEVAAGGVTTSHDAGLFYEEYPCRPPCHVLNGFIYALWGLRDLAQRDNPGAVRLWESGVRTLVAWLPHYDLGYWSLYHVPETPRNPATVAYHRLHINQLDVMYALTSAPIFKEYADRWRHYLSNPVNALRTLPAKVMWLFTGKSTF